MLDDKRLWERLVRKVRRTADAQDAEDVLHSAYLRLRKYRESHPVENAEAFLARTARNIAIDTYRSRAVMASAEFELACGDLIDPAPLQDEVLEHRARLLQIQKRLDQMPARTRQIFEMHRLDKLKYREIAERMGISQSAVEKHIARAVLLLGREADGR